MSSVPATIPFCVLLICENDGSTIVICEVGETPTCNNAPGYPKAWLEIVNVVVLPPAV